MAVLDAAVRLSPIPLSNQAIVGVLDKDRSAEQRTVLYLTTSGAAEYRFVWHDGWQRERLLSGGFDSASAWPATAGLSMSPFTDSIGTVWEFRTGFGTFLYSTLYANNVTQSGTYGIIVQDVGSGHDSSLIYGESYPASKQVGGTDYTIPQDSMIWQYKLKSNPGVWQSCPQGFTFCGFNGHSHSAQLIFYMRVVNPVIVSITAGPSHIQYQGTYSWTAAASGGEVNDPLTYQWEYSQDSVIWTAVGSSATLTRSFASQSQPSFWLRVTSESGSRTATAVRRVTVASPLYGRLSAVIDGPVYINSFGTYTWTALVGGGAGPYSYAWEINYVNWPTWGPIGTNSNSVTFDVDPNGGDQELRVTITSADGQTTMGQIYTQVAGGAQCPPPQIQCEVDPR